MRLSLWCEAQSFDRFSSSFLHLYFWNRFIYGLILLHTISREATLASSLPLILFKSKCFGYKTPQNRSCDPAFRLDNLYCYLLNRLKLVFDKELTYIIVAYLSGSPFYYYSGKIPWQDFGLYIL